MASPDGWFLARPICLRSICRTSSRPRRWMPSCPMGRCRRPALPAWGSSSRVARGSRPALSSAGEALGDFLGRAGAHGVTHISGTPSHWRRALMSPAAHRIAPRYVRLSGEIADQAILDHLRACYPAARIAHAFASTEAGVAFDVDDGLAGFPASLLERPAGGVDLKVEAGPLRIRSTRTATRYLETPGPPPVGRDGFVDTGDMVERRGDRLYFVGRRGGIINVGGREVHPQEVEAVINGHPRS